MHLPLGSLVNAAAIIIGSLIGLLFHGKFPDRYKLIVFQGLGLCVFVIGAQMAFTMTAPLVAIFSIVLGGILGEAIRLDLRLESLAQTMKRLTRSTDSRFAEGLVTASLIYCVGSMAILGSFDEGLRGDATLLYTKSMLDGFASIVLASTHGAGVLFSFVPVFIYQVSLTILAVFLQSMFTPALITQLTSVGGILIIGIGINLLDFMEVKVSNLLPSLVVVVVLSLIFL
ncbi:DUF554 domain-containing protein [Desulfovibrio inopinatus]|uniref:DUF554 domain-containing protein n=1 Tax=Desulfovibrio inopinatus TaxID=102109 RepID=UPI00040EFD72|nr:DUF554 domain-containing protein [Desulfovibrio inopinatus]